MEGAPEPRTGRDIGENSTRGQTSKVSEHCEPPCAGDLVLPSPPGLGEAAPTGCGEPPPGKWDRHSPSC